MRVRERIITIHSRVIASLRPLSRDPRDDRFSVARINLSLSPQLKKDRSDRTGRYNLLRSFKRTNFFETFLLIVGRCTLRRCQVLSRVFIFRASASPGKLANDVRSESSQIVALCDVGARARMRFNRLDSAAAARRKLAAESISRFPAVTVARYP